MFEQLNIRKTSEIEELPFQVRPVLPSEIPQVLALRSTAYANRSLYLEKFKQALSTPDSLDGNPYSITFVAVCKSTNEVLGTVRITSNYDVPDLLPSETPADPCIQGPFAFVDRFAVRPKGPAQVVPSLLKAVWLWTLGRDARWLVALAGAPLARHYKRWGGMTIRADGQSFIVKEDLAEPVFLVAARVAEAHTNLLTHNPQFVHTFISKAHPDINVMGLSHGTPQS